MKIPIDAVLAELRSMIGAQAVDLAATRAHVAALTAELAATRATPDSEIAPVRLGSNP